MRKQGRQRSWPHNPVPLLCSRQAEPPPRPALSLRKDSFGIPKLTVAAQIEGRPPVAFAVPLDSADAVWFSGGRQWRLVDAYSGTKTLAGFRAVLDRGGVIGGSSAGATIQGSFLVRGDTLSNQIMKGNHREGFGFLPESAVDQHLLARSRQYDLIPVIEAHPELLGIGIDENTALVVRGDTARVTGESKVAIYDHRRWARADSALDRNDKLFFLHPGDRFDVHTRTERAPTQRTLK